MFTIVVQRVLTVAAPSVRFRVSLKEATHDKGCSWRSRLEEKAVDARMGEGGRVPGDGVTTDQ